MAWESFGEGWVTDVVKQLKLKDVRRFAKNDGLPLPLAWFVWATATNTRILGDDNESTEQIGGSAGRTHARGFHGRSYHSSGYYHK